MPGKDAPQGGRHRRAVAPDRSIAIQDTADPADESALRAALLEFNFRATGFRDGRSLSCFLRDESGRLIAGIDGFTWGGYAKVETLWVDESLRGQGLGRRLLQAAIEEAAARGCATMVVDTHTFQAPEFYPRFGFQAVGRFDGTPVGHGQVFFQKRLR